MVTCIKRCSTSALRSLPLRRPRAACSKLCNACGHVVWPVDQFRSFHSTFYLPQFHILPIATFKLHFCCEWTRTTVCMVDYWYPFSLTCVIVIVCLQLFSIIVFACILSKGWHRDQCFGSDHVSTGVCGYGTAIGVIAFLLLLTFLALDALFDNVSNVQLRKYIVIADIMCSGEFLLLFCMILITNLNWSDFREET